MPNLTTSRGHTSLSVRAAYRRSPAEASRILSERILPELTRQLMAAIKRGEGWAIRTGFEIARMVQGGQTQIVVALLGELGVRDEAEAKALVASGKRLEQLAETPPATMLHDALEVVKLCVRKEPHLAAEARRVLETLSSAEEVNGTP